MRKNIGNVIISNANIIMSHSNNTKSKSICKKQVKKLVPKEIKESNVFGLTILHTTKIKHGKMSMMEYFKDFGIKTHLMNI